MTFTTEALRFLDGKAIDKMTQQEAFLMLHVANELKLEDTRDKCIQILMNSSVVMDIIKYRVENYFTRYGCEELKFVYDNTDIDEFFNHAVMFTMDFLKKIVDSSVPFPRKEDGSFDMSRTAFRVRLSSAISRPVKWAVRELILQKAKEGGLEQLTRRYLKRYAQIRKATDYKISLDNSNEEIMVEIEKTDISDFSIRQLENIRRGFSYEKAIVEKDNRYSEFKLDLAKALHELDEVQQKILFYRYLETTEKQKFTVVALKVGLTPDQVRYQENKALKYLKTKLSAA